MSRPLILTLTFSVIAISLFWVRHLRAMTPGAPLALAARVDSAQLNITWDSAGVDTTAAVEIIDGGQIITIPVTHSFSGVTYAPSSGDVKISLTSGSRRETTRFVGPEPPATAIELTRRQVSLLEAQAARLKAAKIENAQRIAALRSTINRLESFIDSRPL
jgi:hypothetical protein